MPTPVVNSLLAAIDSHYLAVKQRVQTLNPARKVLGVMDSEDWPPLEVQMESLYCLDLGFVPIGKQGASATIPIVIHTVQWTWLISGTDIQKGIQIKSRGDRYRINGAIMKELEYGMYPGFTQKMNVFPDGNGQLVSLPLDPAEYIMWSPLKFLKKSDKTSGLLYGTASTQITNMTDPILG